MRQAGDRIDIWVVERALGSGGMGSVYRCHNRTANRILAAVKVLEVSSSRKYSEAETRFVREAEILFRLDHPNIVKVRNVRTDTDPPYLEMEFVEGRSLDNRLAHGPIPLAESLGLLEQISSAVAYLHSKGVRHRDIKPSNLLIKSDGKIKLVDFGLAVEADATRITQEGVTFGTVSYAPPEWITPELLEAASWDVYAVGVVTFEMLTGKVAFPASGHGSTRQQAMQIIMGKQGHEPLDPGDEFPDEVRALIRDLTQSNRHIRIKTALELWSRSRELRKEYGNATEVEVSSSAGYFDNRADRPSVVISTPTADVADPTDKARTWDSELVAPERELTPSSPPAVTPTLQLNTVPTVVPDAPSHPWTRWGAAVAVAFLLIAGTAAAVSFWLLPNQPRPVDLVVSGLPTGFNVTLRIGHTLPGSTTGWVHEFSEIQPGPGEVHWVIGEDCPTTSCPGVGCPVWCGTGTIPIDVQPGEEPQLVALSLTPPTEAAVLMRTPQLDTDAPQSFTLGGVRGYPGADGVAFEGVLPGLHDISATIGECEDSATGCWPDRQCPEGCTSYQGTLAVPWGSEVFLTELEIPAPTDVVAPVAEVETAEQSERRQAQSRIPKPVTNAEFAEWLEDQPDWHVQPTVEGGRAHEGYLDGWRGTRPPKGKKHEAAVNVSWFAAAAYCHNRGGLAALSAKPYYWTESELQPFLEWRMHRGKGARRSGDGRKITAGIDLAEVSAITGFRCL